MVFYLSGSKNTSAYFTVKDRYGLWKKNRKLGSLGVFFQLFLTASISFQSIIQVGDKEWLFFNFVFLKRKNRVLCLQRFELSAIFSLRFRFFSRHKKLEITVRRYLNYFNPRVFRSELSKTNSTWLISRIVKLRYEITPRRRSTTVCLETYLLYSIGSKTSTPSRHQIHSKTEIKWNLL